MGVEAACGSLQRGVEHSTYRLPRTPLHQIITHALSNPLNTTKFTLLYANVAEEDILLREDFDALQKKHPSHFKVVYALDKPPAGWTGATGFISQDLIKEHVAPASLAEKVKVFICGEYLMFV